MPTRTNHRLLLAHRPSGHVTDDCFTRSDDPVPEPAESDVLVRVEYLSVDPTNRVWIERDSYMPAVAIGEVVRATGVGTVVESRNERYSEGDVVTGMLGWQEWLLAPGGAGLAVLPSGIPPTDLLSIYGSTGLTAYFGLFDIGRPEPGQTVVVSGAAGGVGSVAGQLARIHGCRVVGIAGTPDKCAWIKDDLGFDEAIDYRREKVRARLRATCPDGIDVYFDNVGGAILDAALENLALRARIVMCGAISGYEAEDVPPGPSHISNLISRRARMEGFLILDYLDRVPEAITALMPLVADGRLQYSVEVVDGLDRAPDALGRLFTGEHRGKQIVKVADDTGGAA